MEKEVKWTLWSAWMWLCLQAYLVWNTAQFRLLISVFFCFSLFIFIWKFLSVSVWYYMSFNYISRNNFLPYLVIFFFTIKPLDGLFVCCSWFFFLNHVECESCWNKLRSYCYCLSWTIRKRLSSAQECFLSTAMTELFQVS